MLEAPSAADLSIEIYVEPDPPLGHVKVFPLSDRDKRRRDIRERFTRVARKLANRLATTGSKGRRVKNIPLAQKLEKELSAMPFDAFSSLYPTRKHALNIENLVFRIRLAGEETLNTRRHSHQSVEPVFIRTPIKHLTLPWDERTGGRFIPSKPSLSLPLTAEGISRFLRDVSQAQYRAIAAESDTLDQMKSAGIPCPTRMRRQAQKHASRHAVVSRRARPHMYVA